MYTTMRRALLLVLFIGGCAWPRETKMEPIAPAAAQTPPPAPKKVANGK